MNTSITTLPSEGHFSKPNTDSLGVSQPPTWFDSKTKAGKERKRLPLACINCRRKKIKCSGEEPSCAHCTKSKLPCVYKATFKKPAPRTEYMSMLARRLKRMEDRVIESIPPGEPAERDFVRSIAKPQASAESGEARNKKPQSLRKRTAIELLSPLAKSEPEHPSEVKVQGTPQNLSMGPTKSELMSEGAQALPPQNIQEHLTEVFFENVYGQSYLLLHKPSFVQELQRGLVPPVLILSICAVSARFSNHPFVNTRPTFLRGQYWASAAREIVERYHFEPNVTIVMALIMLGLHYFGTCEGGLSWSFVGIATRMAYALQLHKEHSHAVGKARSAVSFVDREVKRRLMWSCVFMDVFTSSGTERPPLVDDDYLEIQLPICESDFQREIDGVTEYLHESDIQLLPQCNRPQVADTKASMGVAAYVVRAIILWKELIRHLNLCGKKKDLLSMEHESAKFAELVQKVNRFRMALPETLTYNQGNLDSHAAGNIANQFLFLHIVIAQSDLFLRRFAITAKHKSRKTPTSSTSYVLDDTTTHDIHEAAAIASRIISDGEGYKLHAPFVSYVAFSSSTIHIPGIFSKDKDRANESKNSLSVNYRYLNRMKNHWGLVPYMIKSLRNMFIRLAIAAQMMTKKRKSTESMDSAIEPETKAMIRDQSSEAPRPGQSKSGFSLSTDGMGPEIVEYADWFEKFPNGVPEEDLTKSNAPGRHVDRIADEFLLQSSSLQSLEEFFAALSIASRLPSAEDPSEHTSVPHKRAKPSADFGNTDTDRDHETVNVAKMKRNVQSNHPAFETRFSKSVQHEATPYAQPDIQEPNLAQLRHPLDRALSTHNTSVNILPHETQETSVQTTTSQLPYLSGDFSSNNVHAGNLGQPQNVLSLSLQQPQVERQIIYNTYPGLNPNTTDLAYSSNNQLGLSSNTNAFNNVAINNSLPQPKSMQDNPDLNALPDFDMSLPADLTYDIYDFDNLSTNTYQDTIPYAWTMPFNIDPLSMDMTQDIAMNASTNLNFGMNPTDGLNAMTNMNSVGGVNANGTGKPMGATTATRAVDFNDFMRSDDLMM